MSNKKLAVAPKSVPGSALRLCIIMGILGLGQAAGAATATGPMTVTATVAATCAVGASTLAFPGATSAAIAAGNIDATGDVSVNCTTGSPYTVSLNAGAGAGATLAIRKMTSAALTLNYTVFTSAARTTIWGDGIAPSLTVSGIGSGASQSIPAYGRIFSGQIVPAATYTDTVNVTVSY
ncbi:MAG: spore coat U domain-containing protein [Polaromonas sp.]